MSSAEPIVVAQTFDAPVGRVWDAITDPQKMPKWFFETIADFEPEPGFKTQFDVRADGRIYRHVWTITEVIPEKKIVYDWRYAGLPGESSVVWELSESAAGTRLTVTHAGHETFPQDDPAFSRESGEAGWRYFICDRLKAFLDDR